MISAADGRFGIPERKQVIYQTYQNAVDAGDRNVYFVDGGTIYAPVGRGQCTVDDIHPQRCWLFDDGQCGGTGAARHSGAGGSRKSAAFVKRKAQVRLESEQGEGLCKSPFP